MTSLRILAIDFGSKRVGLALTDPLGMAAQPLSFMPYTGRAKFIADLKKLIEEKSVGLIVLGLPKNSDGTLGPGALQIQKLSERIKKGCKIDVRFRDETFTSREADDILIHELDLSRKKRKKVRDSLAACLILESYLGSNP